MQKKILLIDDAKDMHFLCKTALVKSGFAFESAYNGLDGLTKLTEYEPDLILLDYMMPMMNGHQVYEKIKTDTAYEKFSDLPVIILTAAETNSEEKNKFLNMGLSAYLNKPFGAKELINIIKNLLYTNKLHNVVQKAKNFLESLVDCSPDAIITLDIQGRITYINRGAEIMFGYSDVDLLNRQFFGFCEDSLELAVLFRKINENFSIRHYEIHFRAKNDQFIPVGFSFSRLVDKDSIFSGYLCIGKDLSEIKRLEEQLLEKERLGNTDGNCGDNQP
ncbi:response regulator [candidate division KSB1 bacterium]|nr:response regulator [candidate division KSB1 bacterium]